MIRQQFCYLVEAHRIRSVAGEDRLAFRREGCAASFHLRAIPGDGVDFAIVSDHAQRLGAMPGRQNVGRVALMEDREGGRLFLARKVGVELVEQSSRA